MNGASNNSFNASGMGLILKFDVVSHRVNSGVRPLRQLQKGSLCVEKTFSGPRGSTSPILRSYTVGSVNGCSHT
jgi:hypothetical protein